ncbi:MAG: permease [Nitrospiraceae bacterium]
MTIITGLFAFVAAVLSWIAWQRSPALLVSGWKEGLELFLTLFPLLVFSLGIAGLAQALIPKEQVAEWIGQEAGWRGIWIGALAGTLAPGGPMIVFPMAGALLKAGAGLGTLVAYVTAWSMWGLRIALLESALISPRFALFRFLSCVFVPPLAGGIAHLLFSRFLR